MSTVCSLVRHLCLAALLVMCATNTAAVAQEGVAQEEGEKKAAVVTPSLDSVKWAGKAVSFDTLRGKPVVVLVYATWCPLCNDWSGELFSQIKEAIAGKPVVILAINADKSPQGLREYLTQRGFFAPNIMHGYDPSMVAKLGLGNNLFNYALIGSDGVLQKTGSGGTFLSNGDAKKFTLPKFISESKTLGKFKFQRQDMSDEVSQLLWPLELGLADGAALTKAKRTLSAEGQAELKTTVDGYLDGQLKAIRELAEGGMADKLKAVVLAKRMTTMFRAAKQSKDVRKLLIAMGRDKQFKQELAAKNYYERQMKLAAATPARRQVYLQAIVKRFAGTHYGELAKEKLAE